MVGVVWQVSFTPALSNENAWNALLSRYLGWYQRRTWQYIVRLWATRRGTEGDWVPLENAEQETWRDTRSISQSLLQPTHISDNSIVSEDRWNKNIIYSSQGISSTIALRDRQKVECHRCKAWAYFSWLSLAKGQARGTWSLDSKVCCTHCFPTESWSFLSTLVSNS